MRTVTMRLLLPFAYLFAVLTNVARRHPLGGISRKNPKMTLAVIICCLIFFFMTAVLHMFKPP